MSTIRERLGDQTTRRKWITIASGVALVAGLIVGRIDVTEDLRYPLLLIAAIIAGGDIAGRALLGVKRRQVNIEQLVTIAAVGAIAIGEVWEAAAVTFLFMLGAWLEARTMQRTRRELASLLDLAPETATVLRDGDAVTIPAIDVFEGDMVLVRPGDRVPVDGVVSKGGGSVDESAITGEPMAAEKGAGDPVFAGTISESGVLFLEASSIGADTTLARIIDRVEEAQDAKAPAQRTIEGFARWYTPSIIAFAAVAGVVAGDVELALTLLVIGCPGALVIATPVAVVAGIGRAARRGMLIKGGEFLETVGRVTTVAFDKTGTLTEGRPVLTDVVALQPANVPAGALAIAKRSERDVLWLAAIAEQGSAHPLARPVVEAARYQFADAIPAVEGATVLGKGVWADWEGNAIAVGTPALMVERQISVSADAMGALEQLRDNGKTAMLVAADDEVIGVIAVADTPRHNLDRIRDDLAHVGVNRLALLTGDASGAATSIAGEANIDEVHAGLMPDQKLAWIEDAKRRGEVVAMVGDGINDAPALAAADVGIAMGAAGSDIALETSDIALLGDDVGRISEALAISRKTVRIIRQNLGIAMVTVGALLAGVLAGEVTMAGGMLIHEASVLIVIGNGMRLLRT